MSPHNPPALGLRPRPVKELGADMLDTFAKRFIIRDLKAQRCDLAPARPEWLRVRMARLVALNPWLNARYDA